MKKGTKLAIGIAALSLGAVALTSCTNSFCSLKDKAHILYAFDSGISEYYSEQSARDARHTALEGSLTSEITFNLVANDDTTAVTYYTVSSFDAPVAKYLSQLLAASTKQEIRTPSIEYFQKYDEVFLLDVVNQDRLENPEFYTSVDAFTTAGGIVDTVNNTGLLIRQGYNKFYGEKNTFENWYVYDQKVRSSGTVYIDDCPSQDFVNVYKTQLTNAIASYRSCLATTNGFYGHYNGQTVEIEAKSYGYAWKTGFLSGLLVYPIGWLIDTFTAGMLNGGVASGVAQLLSILFVTLIVRALMLAVTWKQTTMTSKMQMLQPEMAKIQAKYPNANTNQYEKQRLAEETQKLYKKYKINPLTSILVMIVQFPIFICVWSAMQGSAYLSTGSFLGLNLSTSISSVLFTWSNWAHPESGVWTALVLFILMGVAQAVAMLLPQWMQKAQRKKVAKLGRNPAQKESDKKSKIFTYVMLVMIIFMGFSLASALGVYWLVGALFSIAQTLVTQLITNRSHTKKKTK